MGNKDEADRQLTVGNIFETESVSLVDGVGDEANVQIPRGGRDSRRQRPAAVSANQTISGSLSIAHLSTAATSHDDMVRRNFINIRVLPSLQGGILLLGGELLAERCRTDDLLPSIPISCLPPCCMDPKVQGLDILIYCSQPGGSWATNGPPPVCWWS